MAVLTTPLRDPETMTRRFSGRKLARVLARLGKKQAWLAAGVGRTETTVRNWLSGKQPDLDSYLDLVDFLRSQGVEESEILSMTT